MIFIKGRPLAFIGSSRAQLSHRFVGEEGIFVWEQPVGKICDARDVAPRWAAISCRESDGRIAADSQWNALSGPSAHCTCGSFKTRPPDCHTCRQDLGVTRLDMSRERTFRSWIGLKARDSQHSRNPATHEPRRRPGPWHQTCGRWGAHSNRGRPRRDPWRLWPCRSTRS